MISIRNLIVSLSLFACATAVSADMVTTGLSGSATDFTSNGLCVTSSLGSNEWASGIIGACKTFGNSNVGAAFGPSGFTVQIGSGANGYAFIELHFLKDGVLEQYSTTVTVSQNGASVLRGTGLISTPIPAGSYTLDILEDDLPFAAGDVYRFGFMGLSSTLIFTGSLALPSRPAPQSVPEPGVFWLLMLAAATAVLESRRARP